MHASAPCTAHEKARHRRQRDRLRERIGLTNLGGDRLDDSRHPPRGAIGWHDASARITGPAVADVGRALRAALARGHGERLPAPTRLRKRRDHRSDRPNRAREDLRRATRGDFSSWNAHLAALRSAQRFIYLEKPVPLVAGDRRGLIDKLERPPRDEFRVLVVLPRVRRTGRRTARHSPSSSTPTGSAAGSSPARSTRRARTASARLRPREDRHRRRPLAHARLRQPDEHSDVQRHRDEHRRLRRGARALAAPCGSGQSISRRAQRRSAATFTR